MLMHFGFSALLWKCSSGHGERHMNASSGINNGTGTNNRFTSPQRITITVPAMTLKKLVKRSLVEGRSLSNLAAFLLEQTLEGDSQD